jgi:superfamily II DNA helicase RecQ
MVCVDEIHCASEWSHNFRPAYLVLHEMIREKLGADTRVIGLTATATKVAQKQICKIFEIEHPKHIIVQRDLSRLNLQLSITRDPEKTTALIKLLMSPGFRSLTSILIFATSRATTDQIARILGQHGIKAQSYHAGKTDE